MFREFNFEVSVLGFDEFFVLYFAVTVALHHSVQITEIYSQNCLPTISCKMRFSNEFTR